MISDKVVFSITLSTKYRFLFAGDESVFVQSVTLVDPAASTQEGIYTVRYFRQYTRLNWFQLKRKDGL